MSTTLSAAATKIKDRLKIGSGTAEPSTAHLTAWLQDAFTDLDGRLWPVKESTLTVLPDFTVPLPVDQVFYVVAGGKHLVEGAGWSKAEGHLEFIPGVVARLENVTAFYYEALHIGSSTTSVDSTCRFGEDWLEEPAIVQAAMQAYQRLHNVSAEAGGSEHGAFYRVLQEERDKLVAERKAQRDGWDARMSRALQMRMALSPPFIESDLAGFENASAIRTIWSHR